MRYITILFLIFSINTFADNIIHHQVATADNIPVFIVNTNNYQIVLFSITAKSDFSEEVIVIENYNLTNTDFNLSQRYQKLTLLDFMKTIIKEKD